MEMSAETAFEVMATNRTDVISDSAFGATKWTQFVASAFHEGKIGYYKDHMEDMLIQKYAWSAEDARKASAELEKNCMLLNAVCHFETRYE